MHSIDFDELEDQLREQMRTLQERGLDSEESFLVGAKGLGDLDSLSREFAREHSQRLWKQLVLSPSDLSEESASNPWKLNPDLSLALILALGAGILVKLPSLFDGRTELAFDSFYLRSVFCAEKKAGTGFRT